MRISKILLRLLLVELKLFDSWLAPEVTWADVLPDGLQFGDLLRTCRKYYKGEQEAVQLLSFVASCRALGLLKKDPPPPTLASVRPGACVLTDGGGFLGKHIKDLQKLQLGKRSNDADYHPDYAALTKTGGQAMDVWAHLTFTDGTTGVVCMQQKGQMTGAAVGEGGGDAALGSFEAVNLLGDIVALAGGVAPQAQQSGVQHRQVKPKQADRFLITKSVAFELAHTKAAGLELKALMGAKVCPAQRKLRIAWDVVQAMRLKNGDAPTLIVITRDQLSKTLGPVFGNLLTRNDDVDFATDEGSG